MVFREWCSNCCSFWLYTLLACFFRIQDRVDEISLLNNTHIHSQRVTSEYYYTLSKWSAFSRIQCALFNFFSSKEANENEEREREESTRLRPNKTKNKHRMKIDIIVSCSLQLHWIKKRMRKSFFAWSLCFWSVSISYLLQYMDNAK